MRCHGSPLPGSHAPVINQRDGPRSTRGAVSNSMHVGETHPGSQVAPRVSRFERLSRCRASAVGECVACIGNAYVRVDAAVQNVVGADVVTRHEGVVARATQESVLAKPREQDVVLAAALDDVVARAVGQGIVSTAAAQDVIAGSPGQGIRTGTADDRVVAAAADQDVVTSAALDDIVPAEAADHVAAGGADQRVGAGSTGDRAWLMRATDPGIMLVGRAQIPTEPAVERVVAPHVVLRLEVIEPAPAVQRIVPVACEQRVGADPTGEPVIAASVPDDVATAPTASLVGA